MSINWTTYDPELISLLAYDRNISPGELFFLIITNDEFAAEIEEEICIKCRNRKRYIRNGKKYKLCPVCGWNAIQELIKENPDDDDPQKTPPVRDRRGKRGYNEGETPQE